MSWVRRGLQWSTLCVGYLVSGQVRVKDVVLRLHSHMARVSAVCEAFLIRRELVRRSIVVEHRVSPPAGFRKSLAVFFYDESLLKDVWHIHRELGLRALLRLPLELHDHGAFGENLAVARNAGFERIDHGRVGDDDLKHFVGASGRDDRPVLVSVEVGETRFRLGISASTCPARKRLRRRGRRPRLRQ